MKRNWKIALIEGIEVIYTEFKGVGTNRYEMTFLLNKTWKTHSLVCYPNQLEYKMKEIIQIHEGMAKN